MRIRASLLLALVATGAQSAEVSLRLSDAAGQPLADAVAYLVPVGTAPAGAARKAQIDQVDMEFEPLVTVIQTGTRVEFPNGDNTRHQVYSFSPANPFNLKLYAGRPSAPVEFPKAGSVVLGCNIHDHMVGWVLVVDTPWFARADAAGAVRVAGLPAGDYMLHLWHPGLGAELPPEPLKLDAAQSVRLERKLPAQAIDSVRRAMGKAG